MNNLRSATGFLFSLCIFGTCFSADADEPAYRVIIKYGSICCGPSSEESRRVGEILSKYQKEYSTKLESKTVRWGMEGDYTSCYRLSELDVKTQRKLIRELLEVAKPNGRVIVQENAVCKGGWR